MRTSSVLPAVVCGANQDSLSLTVDYNEFEKLYNEAGSASLIDLEIDGQVKDKVLIHEFQLDPRTDRFMHVDLRRIEMGKAMTAMVGLEFLGESGAVKEFGGTLVKNVDEVEVRCLPKDLVSQIEVDLSVLKTFEDVIRIKDLVLPVGITILSPGPEDAVAKAIPALTEEQLKAMDEQTADISAVQDAKEKKEKEGEEATDKPVAGVEDKKEEKK